MRQIGKERMQQQQSNEYFTAVDLFSGGGGLTVGLKKTGFRVVAAVELEQHAFATYKANHPEVQAFKQDIRTIKGESLRSCSPTGEIDLLSGCPPCQGFSTLTARYKRTDPRNELILEMDRLVREVHPRIVMMENVPGLPTKGKLLFDKFLETIESLGYIAEWDVLQVADFGVPQSRQRLVLLAGKGFPVHLPKPTHSRKPIAGLKPWVTLHDAIGLMPEPTLLSETQSLGGPQQFNWHVVRNISQSTLRILQASRPGESRVKLPQELRPPCHQNRKDGFNNVYGRMTWEKVSSTITGGCTTVSKGRFGHPEKDRTISVREAALLQIFPPDYIFDTPYIDHVCEIVGNALPCHFAEVVTRQCVNALLDNNKKTGS
jgi:DNA (cytosine-5)-methyltransferase 1